MIGAGGLPVCVLYIAHRLLDSIIAKGPAIEKLFDARERLRIIARIEHNEMLYAALSKRREALQRVLAAAPRDTARLVLSRIARAIRVYEGEIDVTVQYP